MVIWTIIAVCYPKLASIIKNEPHSLFDTIEYLKISHDFKNLITFKQHFGNIEGKTIAKSSEFVKPIITNATQDMYLYNFLRSLAQYHAKLATLSRVSFRDVVFGGVGLIG